MFESQKRYEVRLAQGAEEIAAAQHLRYRVFVQELGATGEFVDHQQQLEQDRFDAFCDHLILIDRSVPKGRERVVGVYRLLTQEKAELVGQFYSEDEFDLSLLQKSGLKSLELGRSCIVREHRNSMALFHLWSGLAEYIQTRKCELLFGVASFHGTDTQSFSHALSYLAYHHMAPENLRVTARAPHAQPITVLPREELDRKCAMRQMPPLIKAYLRLGGYVGQGAYIDRQFNTIDVCLIIETDKISLKHKALYSDSDRANR